MELIRLLPDYYEDNQTMQLLQKILSGETDKLEDDLSNTICECFSATASKLLARYEKMYGVQTDVTMSDDYRRERIIAKLAGAGTTTKDMIREVAANYSNGEVEIIENNEANSFVVKFIGTIGVPGNMESLKMTIEEIKPAHLEVTYEYIYQAWSFISSLTWEDATTYTWNELRTVK